ncbi:hypothetical protein DFH11DRAFT_1501151 [Phellopilus nigrolimitatus]|nr:hypothetical protein DFH11DRAFT_1501151 [Phellopilus nigrolimitatus]
MPSTPSILCRAKASYKKSPGLLELTHSHLQWTAAGKQAPDLRIPNSKAASLFCSKEGSPQVKLKLALVGDDVGHTFMFTAPQATASTERELFKKEITNIIVLNRASTTDTPTKPLLPSSKTPGHASTSTPKSFTPLPVPAVSRATSVSSNGRASSSAPGGSTEDFRIRKKVLMKNPELATLHRELVMTGQITESEFWEGREHLLLSEAAQESQKRGRPGQIVDPRPETVAGGDTKIVVTPQIIRDIFEEYPVVAKAYNETVPKQLTEAEFWKRYFQSKLYNIHRASIRSSAAQHVVKDDPIFDKYVEREDDELEPRRQRDDNVQIFVNLNATQEDHTESGNQKDTTMQAGRQRGALPLIRKFNEHSERLLNAAEGSPSKRRRFDDDKESLYAQIDLDDLHDAESSAGIILEMKDRDRYFDGRVAGQTVADDDIMPPFRSVLPDVRAQVNDWGTSLSNLKIEKKAGDAALLTMTQNVQARLEVKMRKNDIPEGVFAQMRTCQTAANEFLRQFWSSIYPSTAEGQVLAPATPAQKAAKVAKMAGYLAKTPEKVDAIVQVARAEGVDPTKVEVAMKPVLAAVEKALQFQKSRRPPR